MRFTKRILMVVVFLLLFSFVPEQLPGVSEIESTVSAAAGDDITYYRNITVYPISDGGGDFRGAVNVNAPAFTLINIQYNRTAKTMSFDISPENSTVQGHIGVPINTTTAGRSVRASLNLTFNVLQNPDWEYDSSQWMSMRTMYWENFVDTVDQYGQDHHMTTSFDLSSQADTDEIGYSYRPEPFEPKAIQLYYMFASHINVDNYDHWIYTGGHKYTLIPNHPPTLTVTTPNNQLLINDNGLSGMTIEGYVNDPDNEDVTVTAEIPNVFYKKTVVPQAQATKPFYIPIDAIQDSLPPGNYTMNITASDPSGMKKTASLNLAVKARLRNKAFVLINTPIETKTKYMDSEWDPKYGERFRYDHDPYFFDNSMGIIGDSGLWRSSAYPSFPYSGVYTATFQGRDNPKNDDRFDVYRKWSRDNLSSMTFHVHRKPIALFTAKLAGGWLQLTDSSYDLDHVTASNKGLMDWQWQYKKTKAEDWTDGQPLGQLPSSDQYDIRLRVRDVDGENGAGVWSDWSQRTVGAASNLPPVALFTVEPNVVSYRKATTITDKSFDPDNDPLDVYYWTVVKDGVQVWAHWGGATTPPNIATFGQGNYQINLQVHDNRDLWSEWYSQSVQVINHPPAAAFYMPSEVYRDTLITMENMTPDPDEDGDALSYGWYARLNNSPYYYAGSNRNQAMTIRDLIARSGVSQQQAISDGWEMRLTASDGALASNATRLFTVKNHVPTAAINGPSSVYQYDSKQYTSADEDGDPSDIASLQYFWKVTGSDGAGKLYRTPNIEVNFPEPGTYTLEHWAVDQIGAKSNIASMQVNVAKNLAPSMTLTSPAGTAANPTVLDAVTQGDPLIQWTYSDPENDPQEKYRLEFYTKDSLLAKTVENPDSTGMVRQYQVPTPTFERFEYFTVLGRAYSKGSWSEISNEKMFIIDNPPNPGFTLVTDTGRDATKVPIYRTDVLNIKSTATDPDEPKGDSINYKYYLKPASGTEGLASTQKDFTKQFTSNGIFTLRQVVTDSLGLFRELTQNITVQNRLPQVNITYPTSDRQDKPTIASTLTPIMKWDYQDEDGDLQQRYKVRIINLATGAIKVQSGEQVSSTKQWQIPAGTLIENEKYAVEVEVFDGFDWSAVSARKYFMVNLLSVKGRVRHTDEWNTNRQNYNLKMSGDAEQPRGYNVFWAGERFVFLADTTGLPDIVEVTMPGGYSAQLSPANEDKLLWTGELYDSSFEKLPDGPVTFTFTATNEYHTKTDKVTVVISGNWSDYFRNHRIK